MNTAELLPVVVEEPCPESEELFPGQLSEERVLYIVRPHVLFRIQRLAIALILTVPFLVGWWRWAFVGGGAPELVTRLGFVVLGSVTLIAVWWANEYAAKLRGYVTERRFVRIEPVFPVTEKRRALLWREVMKSRGIAPNFMWRLAKIGILEVSPPLAEHGGSIDFPYVYYFEDLVSYIDKIVVLTKENPKALAALHPFVTKPKGQRY